MIEILKGPHKALEKSVEVIREQKKIIRHNKKILSAVNA
jgi:hypothetical protein